MASAYEIQNEITTLQDSVHVFCCAVLFHRYRYSLFGRPANRLRFREPNPCSTARAAEAQFLSPHRIRRRSPDRTRAMASPGEAAEIVASAAAAAAASEAKGKEEKERREGPRVLRRIWRALFGGRGEDYEKRLQNLSKEEAAVLARMRRRALFSRRGVRNLIALSVLGEVSRFDSLRVTSVKSDASAWDTIFWLAY